MKKLIVLSVLMLLLSSCFGDSEEVKQAKKDLLTGKQTDVIIQADNRLENKSAIEIPTAGDLMDIKGDPRIKITQISGEKILQLNDLKYSDFKSGYSKITGKTLGQVDKIMVSFSNDESDFPSDGFTLKKFQGGDQNFEYNASSKFKVLDFGLNKYRFVAYSGTETSVLELLVLVSEDDTRVIDNNGTISDFKDQEKKIITTDEIVGTTEELNENDLPKGGDYGDIIKLGEDSFTYSDIKGLELTRRKLGELNCGKNEDTDKYYVTEFLSEEQKSWYYWNTCRDIIKGKGISFFVTRLDGENYVYEKHYLDVNHGLYGIYELKKGEGVTSENLSEKNKELKILNDDFESLSVVDSLFKKITK